MGSPTMPSLNYPQIATFNFLTDPSRPSVLNSVVAGTNFLEYFSIETKPGSNYTTISRRNGEIYATINWKSQPCPIIEARGTIERQRTSQWARLSSDRRRVRSFFSPVQTLSDTFRLLRRRITMLKGREYAWVPQGQVISVSQDRFVVVNSA
ncbi:hypothetical protein CPB84DRAFT_1788638 [Gymnopilus junonius]|uniref:DUF6593 domain-containing protein n=1 Tax=Gymnopilus junonius TaxID=109634 RepID=A0A9P5NFC7_GYMJU|nr:hypothetical protein CPB84DRAFT_1788638 [Gymnopilus junonius]